MDKRKWRVIRNYCSGWTTAFLFLSIVRGVGTEELGSLQFGLSDSIIIALTLGPILGAISGYAQILTEERFYRRMTIQRLLTLRLVYALAFLIIMTVMAYITYQLYFGTHLNLFEFAFDTGSAAIYFYVISVDFFLAVLRQVNLMLGENNLGKLLRGKFYTPGEEEMIFMFLDLKSSTTIAEKLGHIMYSELIQDCFNDLGVVVENEAEIYQYVGDEAILIWKIKDGIKNNNCLNAYYNFMQEIEGKRTYYMDKYNCVPFFKAGVHGGMVTVTEVGRYKKEIAYHGDTINTAARIQGMCNEFKAGLLISDYLKVSLNKGSYKFTELGAIHLRGKENQVQIFGVEANLENDN